MYTDTLAQDSYSVTYIQTQKNDTPFFDMERDRSCSARPGNSKLYRKMTVND